MERTLAEFAASDAPLAARLGVARELGVLAEDLAARGKVHGGLAPGAVAVLDGGAVVLRPAAAAGPLERAGFDAPEVARGDRPSRRADAFSVGALAWLALAGRAPFEADGALESLRRVLHAEPGPVRLRAPGVPLEVERALERLLEKRPRRRGRPRELVGAIDAATATPGRGERASRRARALATSARSAAAALARALRALPPLPRTAVLALPVFTLAFAVLPRTGAGLAREVAALLERGDVAGARALADEAARRWPGDPVVEKLRGDVACARGAPGECLRRYRVAIAAREALREDPALRENARRLLDRGQACGTRRAAAQLLGELRDPEALPALEAARRSGGIFAGFCTGDAIDRAIAATRAGDGR